MDELEAELLPAPQPLAIDAVVVSAVPVVVKTAPSSRREHTFSEVAVMDIDRRYKRGKLSERESKFLVVLLKTGNTTRAAEEIGISRVSAWRYMKRPAVKKYLELMRTRAAKAADLTLEKVAAVIGDAVDGGDVSPLQLQAAGLAAKMLAPARGPSVVVNQQNNFNGTSPFEGLDPKAMRDEIRKNLLEMGDSE